jgi:hypothetical protein
MEPAPCLYIPGRREARDSCSAMIDTCDVTGAALAHSDGGGGADVVPMMSAAHSDHAPVADDMDRESMSKDAEERA